MSSDFWDNGYYYFAVCAAGDGVTYANSPYVLSDGFEYTGADAPRLPAPEDLSWIMKEDEERRLYFASFSNWDDYEDKDMIQVFVYDENGEWVSSNYFFKEELEDLGWPVLDDLSRRYLGVGFMLDLDFRNSITYFLFGYLMENCRMIRRSEKRGLCLSAGVAALAPGGAYLWLCGKQEAAVPESLIMLLPLAAYYIIRYIGEKGIRNDNALCHFVLWCGGNAQAAAFAENIIKRFVREFKKKNYIMRFSTLINKSILVDHSVFICYDKT